MKQPFSTHLAKLKSMFLKRVSGGLVFILPRWDSPPMLGRTHKYETPILKINFLI